MRIRSFEIQNLKQSPYKNIIGILNILVIKVPRDFYGSRLEMWYYKMKSRPEKLRVKNLSCFVIENLVWNLKLY